MPVAQMPVASSVGSASTSAVAWIDDGGAIVARTGSNGHETTCEITRGSLPEPAYLAIVVRTIGDRERVLILGPGPARLALEREYVSIYHRPERLVDVEPSGPVGRDELVTRLRAFAA
jgi:hypothetical protein